MSGALLDLRSVSVRYGEAMALDQVSIEVNRGEVVALLGPNGAGKTTMLQAVMGSVRPATGTIMLAGASLDRFAPWQRARRGIAISPEGRKIFPGLSVRENLVVAAGGNAREAARLLEDVFELFPPLGDRINAQGWQLSGGQQQMLAIGRAMMQQPQLLLLDEPTLGLAPRYVGEVIGAVRHIASGDRAVLIADQNAAAVIEIADRCYALQTGRIVMQGPAEEMRNSAVIAATFFGT